jgi:hypothetical protein
MSGKDYATSMAWRPLYQPQTGHTVWGSLADAHFGQLLRAGALSFQFAARRMRTFDWDLRFFGTAMT